jgi:hypothetical protein
VDQRLPVSETRKADVEQLPRDCRWPEKRYVAMRVHALTFVLSDLETGRCLGHALICPDARYASVAWQGNNWLERRLASATDWNLLDLALKHGLQPTPLDRTHVAVRMLLPNEARSAVIVQYLAKFPVDVAPSQVKREFDAQLTSMAGVSGEGREALAV